MSEPMVPNPRVVLDLGADLRAPVGDVLGQLAAFAVGPLAEAIEQGLPANSLRRGDVRWALMIVIAQTQRLAEAWDGVLGEQATLSASESEPDRVVD